MKIVVTGSLGHISLPLTKELVQKGHKVTVVSSKPEKQAAIEALGATAAIGFMEDADFLTATFTGADAVFTMTPPNLGGSSVIENTTNAGKAFATAIKRGFFAINPFSPPI